MDIIPDHNPDNTVLSYDDPVPGPSTETAKSSSSLLSRIGQSRVYALEDSSAAALLAGVKKVSSDLKRFPSGVLMM